MRNSSLAPDALGICAAIAMLTGCGAAQPPVGAPGAARQAIGPARATYSGSWMLPEAKVEDLLYVTNQGPHDMLVFAYPNGKLVGSLKGFGNPGALCVDTAQNVWVESYFSSGDYHLTEYAHGGTTPINVLVDTDYSGSCAVDPTTNNLAVVNFTAVESSRPGNVEIFDFSKTGSLAPTIYQDSSIMYYDSGAYDDSGNLFIVGESQNDTPVLGELPHGGSTFINFSLGTYISNLSNAVLWDGSYVVVVDQVSGSEAVLYRFSVSGSTLTPEGKVQLADEYDTNLFMAGSRVIGGNYSANWVLYWNYPKGYGSTKTISKNLSQPSAVAVSLAP